MSKKLTDPAALPVDQEFRQEQYVGSKQDVVGFE